MTVQVGIHHFQMFEQKDLTFMKSLSRLMALMSKFMPLDHFMLMQKLEKHQVWMEKLIEIPMVKKYDIQLF